MIPLLSLLPDAALPGPSLLPARLYSSWYLPPGSGSGPGVQRYGNIVETFAVKINTKTVNVVATNEIMIIIVLKATRIDHRREDFRMVPDELEFPRKVAFTVIIV